MDSISVELLGRSRVVSSGQELPITRQCFSLLAYLSINRDIDQPLEMVFEQFWSEQEPTKARSNLASALCRLRRAIPLKGEPFVEVSTLGNLRIPRSAPIWFDIDKFQIGVLEALASPTSPLSEELRDGLVESLAYYRGDLLLGWCEEWALVERQRLRMLCLRGHRRLMEHFSAAGDLDAAISAGQAALAMEPLQESVQRRVIELYAANGQRWAALRQFQESSFLLRKELGVAPSKETCALIERVRC